MRSLIHVITLGLLCLAAESCQGPGWKAEPPPLQVPELEPVDVAPGQPVSPGEWSAELQGVELAKDEAVISCIPLGSGVNWFILKTPYGRDDRWYLHVRPGTRQQDRASGSEVVVPPQIWFLSEGGAWGRWDSPEPVDQLKVEVGFTDFDVELRPSGGQQGSSVRVRGWMRCPDLEAPNQVPEDLVDLLRKATGAEVNRWSTFEFGRLKDHRAISARVRASGLDRAVRKIREALPAGWTAFVGTQRFVDDPPEASSDAEIVVAPGGEMEDILRIAHVSPVNYDMDTEDVVAQFQAWHARYGVDILRADVETVRFTVADLPDNEVADLARQVYEFCPDTVDQGLGTLEALEDEIRENSGAELWWD